MWLFCHRLKTLDKDVVTVTRSLDAAISSSIEVRPRRSGDGLVNRLVTPVVSVADLCSIHVGMRLTEISHRVYAPDALQLRTLTHSFVMLAEVFECTMVLIVGTLEALLESPDHSLQLLCEAITDHSRELLLH